MAIHCLSALLCRLHPRAAMLVGCLLGWTWFYLVPVRRSLAIDQVQAALGPLPRRAARRIVRQSFVNLAQMAIEGLRAPVLDAAHSERYIAREGFEHVDAMLARGRGVVAVTVHLGNFELLGTSQTVRGYPIDAILKDIGSKSAQAFWQAARAKTGLGAIAPRRSRSVIMAALGRNRIVAFLIDQHMAPYRSMVCTFFGRPAATTTAPVRIALASGAPILPLFIVREGRLGHHRIIMQPEFELESPYPDATENLRHNTQRLNDLVEDWVRAYPGQWLWAHRRWKVLERPEGHILPAGLRHHWPSP